MDVQKVTVRVPATSANCGPGFDCLGLACSLYNIFTFERIPQGIEVSGVGEGAETLPLGRHNLAVISFFKIRTPLIDLTKHVQPFYSLDETNFVQ